MKLQKDKLVSVIITTYKRPTDILKRAIMSAIGQTYKNIEIIIVNDCPEQKELSKEIKKMISTIHDNRIKYIELDKNQGACIARNIGIKNSNGYYIALLDDDDEWVKEKIELQIKKFKKNVGLVYCQYYNVDNITEKKKRIDLGNRTGNLVKNLLKTNCVGGCSMPLIKTEVFEKCGYFDSNFPSSQDYDMWLRIAEKYDIECVDEPLVIRYLQDDSISNNLEKKKKGFEAFMKKHKKLYEMYPREYNYRLNDKAERYFQLGDFKEAFELYKKALKIKKISVYNIRTIPIGMLKFIIKRKR